MSSNNRTTRHKNACRLYKKTFVKKFGYAFCEVCGVNENASFIPHQVHHIYFASRVPNHLQLHNPRNLILVCNQCHDGFHAGDKFKNLFKKLEKERNLKELFS